MFSSGVVSTIAGQRTVGYVDGQGTNAGFNSPKGIALTSFGFLVVVDTNNFMIRLVSPAGDVTTIAGMRTNSVYADGIGTQATFPGASGIILSASGHQLLVCDSSSNSIRMISTAGN